ncbi:hypothetical protein IF655_01015 [Streptomyces sp. DSM 110735]|uniref:hypothetical protein n=1 Tax=Streptomyces sp. DSM 110735 TaxID=2775031 RepID=UPI0018F3E83F|nr:hypothetical protein [Streptomyces sp. DSM 110735]MBJ7901882.1 hypothetical protein [Streptomyces sp. DSM 110735]
MSVGGAGIPRLQELAYIETAALAVARGDSFEQIRVAMVDRAERIARQTDLDGSFDSGKWAAQRADHRCHVHNTVDVLKELMRLGWVERHVLPSSPRSAYAHAHVVFELTGRGREWTESVSRDVRAGYNVLVGELIDAHPQFEGFLRVTGARPDSESDQLTIPLLRWEGASYSGAPEFLRAFVRHVTECLHQGGLGWKAEPEAAESAVRDYVTAAVRRAETRITRWEAQRRADEAKRARGTVDEQVVSGRAVKPPPALTAKRIASFCEEAAVRLAFTASGCPMDYISHELLRRWTRFMGLANFSYYTPGPAALRIWATGAVAGSGPQATFRRSVGRRVRRSLLAALPRICQQEAERSGGGTEYCSVWRVRAAACWQQRISDDEFDAALLDAYRGDVEGLPFRLHLDGASDARTPASTRPLVLETSSGIRRVFHVMRLDEVHREVGVL